MQKGRRQVRAATMTEMVQSGGPQVLVTIVAICAADVERLNRSAHRPGLEAGGPCADAWSRARARRAQRVA